MSSESNSKFRDYFTKTSKPMLLDGAIGTQLMLRGLKLGECPEMWNIDKPKIVQEVSSNYFNAGSDAVLTNTFGANPIRLRKFDLEESSYTLNREGAQIALSVCPKNKLVLGSIGPTGEFIMPYGNLSEKEVIETYSDQIMGLADGGVDAFILETFEDLKEMECVVTAIKDNSNLPYLCSMTFAKSPAGYFTTMGVSVAEAVNNLQCNGAFAVGSNCGNGIESIIEIAVEMRKISKNIRIFFEPNAGSPKLFNGIDTYDETPAFFREHLPKLLEYNISLIGGCCGTTPKHIKVMREFLDESYRA